jgi:uncharacterized Zn-finger protein
MAIKAKFKCYIPFCKFTTKLGKDLNFLNHEHITDNENDIKELMEEVANGHPHIYIDKDDNIVDTAITDPLEEIKRKAVEEYLAKQEAAVDATKDLGTTEAEPLKPTSSLDILKAAAGSSSSGNTAAIAAPAAAAPAGK